MTTLEPLPFPVLGIAASSGTGKTTLLEQLIPLLKERGIRVGLIKKSHHDFEIDKPGKDSDRLRKAGARQVLIASPHRRALITEMPEPLQEPKLEALLQALDPNRVDLVLVEGFRADAIPKIELHRPSLGREPIYPNDPNVIAVAHDGEMNLPSRLTPLDLNAPRNMVAFIARWMDEAQS